MGQNIGIKQGKSTQRQKLIKKICSFDIYEQILKNDATYQPDEWQNKAIYHEGNLTIRAGRQVGKSVTVSKRATRLALKYQGKNNLMIAAAQRQSSLLFEKSYGELWKVHNKMLEAAGGWHDNPRRSARQNMDDRREFEMMFGIFQETPTKTCIRLKHDDNWGKCPTDNDYNWDKTGSTIYALPAGKSGIFIKGYTIHFLYVDEAAFIPEPVWTAIVPMLVVPRKEGFGWLTMLSTPFGKAGYFYLSFTDPDFLQIHVNSEQCPRISRDFLQKERLRLNRMEYAQEWQGEFMDEFRQYFPSTLINNRMTFLTWEHSKDYNPQAHYYLGSDVARLGNDDNTYCINEWTPTTNKWRTVKAAVMPATDYDSKRITRVAAQHIQLDEMFHFRKILTDDTGVGGGVTDILMDELGKHRVIGINNAQKSIDDHRKGRVMKEDLYSNALRMMEDPKRPLDIIANLKLKRSLQSVTYEYTVQKNLAISGKYDHLAEAFVRACWGSKVKGLRLFAY